MTPERWSQIERLYHAARELDPNERAAFLEKACAGDADVRSEVESLLANDRDEFLETPALKVAALALAEDPSLTASTRDAGLVGTTVSHYRIVGELGRGGMGVVYKAEDTRLGRLVALKFLRELRGVDQGGSPGGSPRAQALERFKREARAASALNHPNICIVHDVGQHEGAPFIVMEYLEGRTLRQCIDEGALKIPAVIDLAIQIADALAAAHAQGMIHRDIKPTNILVTTRGEAKILDFGLAKPQAKAAAAAAAPGGGFAPAPKAMEMADPTLTNPGMTVGTVAYMSPEQARGEELDARSDLFSFGTLLYEMASGRHPFPGNSASAILHGIVAEEPAALAELNPLTPPELNRIVSKALEKDRDLRFQSAVELRSDLRRLKRDSSSERSPAAGVMRVPAKPRARARWLRGWRAPAILAAAAVVGAVAGWLELRPLAVPRVTNYQQLTNDGVMKTLVATDGVRLYLHEDSGAAHWVAQMTVNGGEPARLTLPSPLFNLFDVSPDGTKLLAGEISTYEAGPLWVVPVLGASPYRVGNLEASSGAWSPDGQRVIYTRERELLVAQSDGSGARKLADFPGGAVLPVWSPDGGRIRLTISDEARHTNALWEVSARGLNPHPLFPKDAPNSCCGRWTSDGRYFVFSRQGQIWALPEPRGIFRQASPQPVQLTSGAIAFDRALPSKDGQRLFAAGYGPRGEVVRYDARKRSFVPLLPGISADFVTFSRDGEWIAYVTFPEGVLWRSRTDQTERVQLTQPSANSAAVLPRWSPDGTQVLYSVTAAGQLTRTYLVPAGGGRPEELSAGPNQVLTDPNWSADGKRICYCGDHLTGRPSNAPNIHILDLASRTVSDVPGSEEFFSPRWSPDGRYLAALSLDSSRIGIFDFSAGKWRDVAQGSFFSFPCWSHDSRAIYYIQKSANPAVMRIRLEGRGAERAVDLRDIRLAGFYGFSLSLTPDDQPVLVRDVGAEEVFALDWATR